jgi:hypothetical protein
MKSMKKTRIVAALSVAALLLGGGILLASDHGDAPAVTSKSTDITDLYVYQSPANADKMVFTANVQGLLSPTATKTASFDENTLIEFKIDNTGDNVEDLVIQCVYKSGKMYIYGPYKPKDTGTTSFITGTASAVVDVTPSSATSPIVTTSANGITAFAGPRDDPFFFDIGAYVKVVTGVANSFSNPGSDSLAGTNVLSVVLDMPKSLLKSTGKINVWLDTKSKN